jgi:hypothetical protein
MPNENPITYEELSEEHKQKLLLRLISSARLKGPVTTAGGRGFHLKEHLMKWIYLLLQKNALELFVRKSTT